GEGVELIHHLVHDVLQLKDFTFDVDRDLLGQIAAGDGSRHAGDVAYLRGQAARHRIDVVRQVLPRAGNALDVRLPTQLALEADLAGYTGHLRGERVELVHHFVHDVLELEDF